MAVFFQVRRTWDRILLCAIWSQLVASPVHKPSNELLALITPANRADPGLQDLAIGPRDNISILQISYQQLTVHCNEGNKRRVGVASWARVGHNTAESRAIGLYRQDRLRVPLQQTRRVENRQLSAILRSQHQRSITRRESHMCRSRRKGDRGLRLERFGFDLLFSGWRGNGLSNSLSTRYSQRVRSSANHETFARCDCQKRTRRAWEGIGRPGSRE